LEAIAADSRALDGLPLSTLAALYEQAGIATARLQARLLTAGREANEQPPERVVLIEDAAKLLKTSPDALYSRWRRLPFAYKDTLDGKLKFRVSGIERYIATRRPGT
jgi:hypothetical protein